MDVAALLIELYGRIPPLARDAVDGADLATLTRSPAPGANTIAWLVWHSGRVQDHHITELIDAEQIWVGDDWGNAIERQERNGCGDRRDQPDPGRRAVHGTTTHHEIDPPCG
jgi:hypothetical protein